MAEETAPPRRPNRALSIVLLVLNALGSGALFISAFWAFFHEDRGTAMWHVSFGTLWFMFFSWAARAAMRPFPAQDAR